MHVDLELVLDYGSDSKYFLFNKNQILKFLGMRFAPRSQILS